MFLFHLSDLILRTVAQHPLGGVCLRTQNGWCTNRQAHEHPDIYAWVRNRFVVISPGLSDLFHPAGGYSLGQVTYIGDNNEYVYEDVRMTQQGIVFASQKNKITKIPFELVGAKHRKRTIIADVLLRDEIVMR